MLSLPSFVPIEEYATVGLLTGEIGRIESYSIYAVQLRPRPRSKKRRIQKKWLKDPWPKGSRVRYVTTR
jgi:hypothetical protein